MMSFLFNTSAYGILALFSSEVYFLYPGGTGMETTEKRLARLGLRVPKLLLPAENVDMTKWAVVACDQYTSEREYWKEVDRFVGKAPSTLRLIFPEAFLEDSDSQERIRAIRESMAAYLSKGVLRQTGEQFMLVKRSFGAAGHIRWGLVGALDLEMYDYGKGSTTLIRATEGTIVSRIPPRMRIRENAPMELPHILVLIDDPERRVIEPLALKASSLPVEYDFDLMMKSGHVSGYRVDTPSLLSGIADGLERLADREVFRKRHGNADLLLFAMGDGNHSLATAKAVWEAIKKQNPDAAAEDHPARYALVEIENIYDPGSEFEPIYRVLCSVDPKAFLEAVRKTGDFQITASKNPVDAVTTGNSGAHTIGFVSEGESGLLVCDKPSSALAVGTLQNLLDSVLGSLPGASIDYIHGIEATERLGKAKGNIGFFFPGIEKRELFETVIRDGALPRKTFSMGSASEKRFYIEGRVIQKG